MASREYGTNHAFRGLQSMQAPLGITGPDEPTLLANLWFARPLGHTIEALRWCLGHKMANPRLRVSLVLNADGCPELAHCCSFVERTYPVRYEASSSGRADVAESLAAIPREWDYVIDSWRAHDEAELRHFPTFARYMWAANEHFTARVTRGVAGATPPPYTPNQRLTLELLAESIDRARRTWREGRPRIALTPSGGSYGRSMYPSIASWQLIVDELSRVFPDNIFCFIGKLRSDGRTSTVLNTAEHAGLVSKYPAAIDCFDWPLLDQLAMIQESDLFLSPHSGIGMAAMAVGTPWLVLSGGQWYEYFLNGVPFYSVLPDRTRYPSYGFFTDVPVLVNDEDDEGPRTPSMTRARIVEDLPDLLSGAEMLVTRSLTYEQAARRHFQNLLAYFGGDESQIESFDNVHRYFI